MEIWAEKGHYTEVATKEVEQVPKLNYVNLCRFALRWKIPGRGGGGGGGAMEDII